MDKRTPKRMLAGLLVALTLCAGIVAAYAAEYLKPLYRCDTALKTAVLLASAQREAKHNIDPLAQALVTIDDPAIPLAGPSSVPAPETPALYGPDEPSPHIVSFLDMDGYLIMTIIARDGATVSPPSLDSRHPQARNTIWTTTSAPDVAFDFTRPIHTDLELQARSATPAD